MVSRVDIRLANPDDAEVLSALHEESDPAGESTSSPDRMRALIKNDGSERVFVASIANTLVGFATLQVTHSCLHTRQTAELTEIFVLPSHRRSGIASQLIAFAISEAEKENSLELFLRVNESNIDAISFYESNKFSRAEHYVYRKKYYR